MSDVIRPDEGRPANGSNRTSTCGVKLINVIKLILVIVAVLGVLAVCVTPAAAETKTWDRGFGATSWHDGNNWDPDGEPQAGNDVAIPVGTGGYLVVISSADAACKTLDIEIKSELEITGKTLTLSDSNANTTSNLDSSSEFGDVTNDGAAFGTTNSSQAMVFGASNGDSQPEISGSGVLESNGRIQFTIVTFDTVASGNLVEFKPEGP